MFPEADQPELWVTMVQVPSSWSTEPVWMIASIHNFCNLIPSNLSTRSLHECRLAPPGTVHNLATLAFTQTQRLELSQSKLRRQIAQECDLEDEELDELLRDTQEGVASAVAPEEGIDDDTNIPEEDGEGNSSAENLRVEISYCMG